MLTDRLRAQVERFYSIQQTVNTENLDMYVCFPVTSFIVFAEFSDGWETKRLDEFYATKAQHRQELIDELASKGKMLEDAITNKLTQQLEIDRLLAAESSASAAAASQRSPPPSHRRSARSRSRSSSPSSRSSRSRSHSRSPPRQRFKRSPRRSASPEARPSFGSGGGGNSRNAMFVS